MPWKALGLVSPGACNDGMDPALTFPKGLCMSQDGNEPSGRKAREGLKVNVRTLGIDLAKNVFRVHGVDANGKILVARQLRRRQLLPFIAQLNLVWSEWKRAVARIISPARLRSTDTK